MNRPPPHPALRTSPARPGAPQRRLTAAEEAAAAAEAAAFAAHARQVLDRHLPDEDYRPLSRRRHLQLAVAGVLTACALFWVMAERPGKKDLDPRLLPADSARCAAGQTQNCVGGQVQVIVPPVVPAGVPTGVPTGVPAVVPVFAVPASAPGR